MFPSVSHTVRWLLVAVALGGASSATAQATLGGRASLAAGADTNPLREYAGQRALPEPMGSFQLGLDGQLPWKDRAYLLGAYDAGLRGYLFTGSANTVTQALSAEGAYRAGASFAFGLEARGKDRRGGGRDYTDLLAGPFGEVDVGLASVRARAYVHRFIYRPLPDESFGSFDAGVSARLRLDRRHLVALSADAALRTYGVPARAETGLLGEDRRDVFASGTVAYSYRGPFAAGVGYTFSTVRSNSFGQARLRHRFTANAGVRLPWEWMALTQLALQLEQYPDGVYLSPDVTLLDDDENTSSASFRFVRPLTEAWDLELRYALYQARFVESRITYVRQLATVGVTLRF